MTTGSLRLITYLLSVQEPSEGWSMWICSALSHNDSSDGRNCNTSGELSIRMSPSKSFFASIPSYSSVAG
eukprot:2332448-Amphidinium_carterae.1